MDITNELLHKLLNDFEVFDEIQLKVIPRYKTSALSGNEWRISISVRYLFKGVVIAQKSYSSMQYAIMFLGHDWVNLPMSLRIKASSIIEQSSCDQPGCSQKAVGKLQLKRETSRQGQYLEPTGIKYYRQFCLQHIKRGDADREDADDNYIALDKVSAADSQNTEESPSVFGGVIDATAE